MAKAASALDIMAPVGPKRKLSNVLDICFDLERRLPTIKADTVASAALTDTLRRWITRKQSDHFGDNEAVHKAAVTLWNLVLHSEREVEKASTSVPTEYKLLLLHSRVFAFVIMHNSTCPDMSRSPPEEEQSVRSQVLYLMDIAVRVARACIDNDDTELGHVVFEHVETYRQTLTKLFPGPGDEHAPRQKAKFEQLRNSYVTLQLTQLSKENRLSDADRLYSETRANNTRDTFDHAALEELSECLYRIGNALLSKKEFSVAIIWLDRAHECLSKVDRMVLSPEMKDFRISTIHTLALASLGVQTPAGNKRAQELMHALQSDNGGENSRRIQLIQLELFASPLSDSFDADGYANVLLQMVGTFDPSAAEFQLLHHHIQKLHNKSPGLGCKVLDDFLLALRHRDDTTEWIEKLIITRVWLLAHQRETPEEIDAVQSVLSKLRIRIRADTASAAQTLIWKRIEQGYQERNYAAAVRWCRLALCHVFEASGRTNRPLIERKLLLCCIENGDVDTAKSIYINMPEPTRDEPMTKYLLYQLAIKTNDMEMATECLRGISISGDKMKVLYACILHARHEKAPHFMVQAMKRLADAINHDPSNQDHAPALFRCAILMLRDIIDGGGKEASRSTSDASGEIEQAVKDIADMFGGAVDAMETDRSLHTETKSRQFTIDELEWFCRAAYNLGLRYSGTWDLRHTVSILEACVKITNLFPVEKEVHTTTDVSSKRLTCRFLVSSALAALVRRPSTSAAEDQTLKDCHAMREHIRSFYTELKKLGKLNAGAQHSDLTNKLLVLLVFDFEGAIRLGDWDELEGICDIAATCQDSNTLLVLGDSLLRSQALIPSNKFVSALRLIVSKLHAIGKFGGDKLIKYYRCLFQAALYRDNDAAFQVLEEVKHMIDEGLNLEAVNSWPEEELQFLAAVAFNEGIDWFAGGREDQARQWVLSAANLAGQCHDGGKLKTLIGSRFGLLNIGDLEIKQSVESDPQEITTCDSHSRAA